MLKTPFLLIPRIQVALKDPRAALTNMKNKTDCEAPVNDDKDVFMSEVRDDQTIVMESSFAEIL